MKKNGEFLTELVENALVIGEIPYKANRRAVEALDVQDNREIGTRQLVALLDSIDDFSNSLQEVEDAARSLGRNAASVL